MVRFSHSEAPLPYQVWPEKLTMDNSHLYKQGSKEKVKLAARTLMKSTINHWSLLYVVRIWLDPFVAEIAFSRPQKSLKISKPCHVGIHWKALPEHYRMSTNVPGFPVIFSPFGIILFRKSWAQTGKGLRCMSAVWVSSTNLDKESSF